MGFHNRGKLFDHFRAKGKPLSLWYGGFPGLVGAIFLGGTPGKPVCLGGTRDASTFTFCGEHRPKTS